MPRSVFAPIGRAFIPASRERDVKQAINDFLKHDAIDLRYGAQPVAIGAFFGSVADAAGPPRSRGEIFEVTLGSAMLLQDSCRGLSVSEALAWQETAAGLSAQFADYGLPIRILFDADMQAAANNTGAHSAQVPVMACDATESTAGRYRFFGTPIDQLQGDEPIRNGQIEINENSARVRTHESGHAVTLQHPPLHSMHPDLARQICDGSADALPSRMRYESVCKEAGFLNSEDGARDPGKLGPTDLCALELATTHHTQQEAVLANCENKIYDYIAAAAGSRTAWFFTASVASAIVERALVHAVFRNTDPGFNRNAALLAASGVAGLVRATIVAQGVGGIAAFGVGTYVGAPLATFAGGLAVKGVVKTGLLGPLVGSVAGFINEHNLIGILYGLWTDASWTMSAMVGSAVGTPAGNAVGAVLDAILEYCAPLPEEARAAKADYYRPASEKPPRAWPALVRPAVEAINGRVAAGVATSYEGIMAIQRSLAAGLDRYFVLGGLTMYICPADQEKVDEEHGIERIVREAGEAASSGENGGYVTADDDDS
ncbi:MAG: hypothetical protein V4787_23610 [Pseudomonadota bacterium]